MEYLRWILIAGGILVIAAVYFFSRRRDEPRDFERHEPEPGWLDEPSLDAEPITGRVEPQFDAPSEPLPVVSENDLARTSGLESEVELPVETVPEAPAIQLDDELLENPAALEASPPPVPQKIISLQILAREGLAMSGSQVRGALAAEGLEYGMYQVFHRSHRDEEGISSIFSIANLNEPGSFDLDTLPTMDLHGLSMFMVLPGPKPGVEAFADMLATGRRLATQLDAELTDQQGSTMSRQTADHLRDSIIDYELQVSRARDDYADELL